LRLAAALCIAALAGAPCLAGDVVLVEDASASAEIGTLVSGRDGATGLDFKDRAITGPAGRAIEVGDVHGGDTNRLLVFQKERAVAIEYPEWKVTDVEVRVKLSTEFGIPVCVWLVPGTTTPAFNRSVIAAAVMGTVWRDENAGLKLGTIRFGEIAKTDTSATPYVNFKCTKVGCREAENLRKAVGFTPAMVNIYFVDMVDYGAGMSRGNAVWCGDDTIVLGSMTTGTLLAHEFGHAAMLGHVDGMSCFDETNVMHSSSDTRAYLTEGQTFRMHADPASVISGEPYELRPGLPLVSCGDLPSAGCPELHKRIWTDCVTSVDCVCAP